MTFRLERVFINGWRGSVLLFRWELELLELGRARWGGRRRRTGLDNGLGFSGEETENHIIVMMVRDRET